MYRLRLQLPKPHRVRYRYWDVLHDALVQGWLATGLPALAITGPEARPWNFAPLGYHHDSQENYCHTLIVSTPDPLLGTYLPKLDPAAVRYARAITQEQVNFYGARITPEADPIVPGQETLGALLLSPLVVRDLQTRRWWESLQAGDLSAAVNARLSRLMGRPVQLTVTPDSLYLRANPKHSVLVPLKGSVQGRTHFAIGLSAPLVLSGPTADLRLAWYAGIGEKNRAGLGCIGLISEGVGR